MRSEGGGTMGKVAFVYAGQGDQYPGMGQDLTRKYPAAARVFARCDALRPGTSDQCFFGTEEALRETAVTQPCLFAMEMAATAALLERGIRPDAAAGFSLGELSAAAASGVFDLETGFRLVCRRGQLMQDAAAQADTAMAAVLRLTPEQVENLCRRFPHVYPVNYNGPGQIAVSGLAEELPAFSQAVRELGGRTLPLKVKGAFHSPFMAAAAEAFETELAGAALRQPTLPLYSDLTGQRYTEDTAALLSRQICRPVQWERLVRNMLADGVDTFIEVGPGCTLTNMIRRIDPAAAVRPFTELLEETPC